MIATTRPNAGQSMAHALEKLSRMAEDEDDLKTTVRSKDYSICYPPVHFYSWLQIANPIVRLHRVPGGRRVTEAWVLYKDLQEKLLGEDTRMTSALSKPIPYEISPVGPSGRGMLASRNIQHGELILVERPKILMPLLDNSDKSLVLFMVTGWLMHCLYRLEQEDREKILQLPNCRPLDEYGPLAGLFYTNYLGVDIFSSLLWTKYAGICLELSYVNHSCGCNAILDFQDEDGYYVLRAERDISAGEEITTAYIDPYLPRYARRKFLRDKYGFKCTCPRCSARKSLRNASDERRMLIQDALESVENTRERWLSCASRNRASMKKRDFKTIRAIFDASDEENLFTPRKRATLELVYMYGILGNEKKFRNACREYMRLSRPCCFEDELEMWRARWEGVIRDPKTFTAWGHWF